MVHRECVWTECWELLAPTDHTYSVDETGHVLRRVKGKPTARFMWSLPVPPRITAAASKPIVPAPCRLAALDAAMALDEEPLAKGVFWYDPFTMGRGGRKLLFEMSAHQHHSSRCVQRMIPVHGLMAPTALCRRLRYSPRH